MSFFDDLVKAAETDGAVKLGGNDSFFGAGFFENSLTTALNVTSVANKRKEEEKKMKEAREAETKRINETYIPTTQDAKSFFEKYQDKIAIYGFIGGFIGFILLLVKGGK